MQDRYTGVYSGGRWLALANADELVDEINTRAQFCLCGIVGPSDGDVEAGGFWTKRPDWIAVGETPQEALEALRNQMMAATEFAVQTAARCHGIQESVK